MTRTQISNTQNLERVIAQRIACEGPIPFRDYMDMALYHETLGYYTGRQSPIGRQGDFFTGPTLSKLFGEMLCKQLREMWVLLGYQDFTVIEFGAGTGALCREILSEARSHPQFYDCLTYFIVEKNPRCFEDLSKEFGEKVNIATSIEGLCFNAGCVLSNELVDNFPVHKVRQEDCLMEAFVDYQPGKGFSQFYQPANDELSSYLEDIGVVLQDGMQVEISLQAAKWIAEAAGLFKRGFILTIDYGGSSEELYCASNKNGSLHGYRSHQRTNAILQTPGEQDITSFVNFSALSHFGKCAGLQNCGYSTQPAFLHGLGLASEVRKQEKEGKFQGITPAEKTFLLNTLLLTMGSQFKVLAQQKEVEHALLPAFQFSSLSL